MAFTFSPEQQNQHFLFGVLGVLVSVGAIFAWFAFFRDPPISLFQEPPPPPQEVRVDFEVFTHPAFLELGEARPPIPVPALQEVGKQDPFVL